MRPQLRAAKLTLAVSVAFLRAVSMHFGAGAQCGRSQTWRMGVFALMCWRRWTGPCRCSLSSIQDCLKVPLGCKATRYAAIRSPRVFPALLETVWRRLRKAH